LNQFKIIEFLMTGFSPTREWQRVRWKWQERRRIR